MSDFWAKRLGQQPQPQQPAPAPPASGVWWQPRPVAPTAQTPAQQPQPVVQQQPTNPGEAHFGELIQQQDYQTTKAMSSKDSDRCPSCDSGNFIAPMGFKNAIKQCFDCGYNERFLHSTHGISGIGQKDIPIKVARAQLLSENNFNPQQIVGHVTL